MEYLECYSNNGKHDKTIRNFSIYGIGRSGVISDCKQRRDYAIEINKKGIIVIVIKSTPYNADEYRNK